MTWHAVASYSIYRLISELITAAWRRRAAKPCRHGVRGGCAGCQADTEARKLDEFARSSEGMRLARQKELKVICEEYSAIEEEMRESFLSKVEDRVRRYDLKYGSGDMEAAVIRMYRAHLSRKTSK